ncbi:MAG TPA: BREX system ATP-binding protein BrxD [Methanoregulaceae archaeon]|nr:MAG: BREX system ATP-binding protein BrxD [Methanolinea sp.]HON81140.1 BREX system ATP-binding protein BrxD [Methanoregulaceae archaeon]HPD09916.1 BREX system ATP-binding protein BrxD [Methanoregulaceae archaeon]HRT14893.1 BREX system ATP-binding protein BrxD [Methanoregulaceae archaeon]HRU30492.1 BREX system ATP-binding protein BrxD [Methanoregulaceae archaeon]
MPIPQGDPIEKRRLESLNIINALRRGTVPAGGLERIAVGVDLEEDVIGAQFDYVAKGGGDLKFVRGDYGSGKTFLVARSLEIARGKGFVTAHVTISPSAPLYRQKNIYQQICASLRTREEEHALKAVIDSWLFSIEERLLRVSDHHLEEESLEKATLKEIETALASISEMNSSLAAALRTYYRANNAGDFQTAQSAIGWISAEPNIGREFKQKAGIRGDVDETYALIFLKGLVRIIVNAGYAGLAVAIDELETTQVLPRNQRDKAYNTLRLLVDSLDRGDLPYCYFVFTGTPAFFEGPRGVRSLPSLADRIGITGTSEFKNPRQPQIVLSRFDASKLEQVAQKVIRIYSEAYAEVDQNRVSHRFIRTMIGKVTGKFGGRVDVIPRIFLKEFMDVLDKCELYEDYDPWESYQFDARHLKGELREEEEAVMVVEF